mmetsp:Transcript_98072/g.218720  ORF Transcript_98072/g.218720 Transcript_98072/m.218720 type:complete len:376 (+) Transcript_98072:813-1940(+)
MLLAIFVPTQIPELPLQPHWGSSLAHMRAEGVRKLLQAMPEGPDGLSLHLGKARIPRWIRFLFLCAVLKELDGASHERSALLFQDLHTASGGLRREQGRVASVDAADEGVDETFESLDSKVPGHKLLDRLLMIRHGILDADGAQACTDLPGPRQEVAEDRIRWPCGQGPKRSFPPNEAVRAGVGKEDVLLETDITCRCQDRVTRLKRVGALLPEAPIASASGDVAADAVACLCDDYLGARQAPLEAERGREARDASANDHSIQHLLSTTLLGTIAAQDAGRCPIAAPPPPPAVCHGRTRGGKGGRRPDRKAGPVPRSGAHASEGPNGPVAFRRARFSRRPAAGGDSPCSSSCAGRTEREESRRSHLAEALLDPKT